MVQTFGAPPIDKGVPSNKGRGKDKAAEKKAENQAKQAGKVWLVTATGAQVHIVARGTKGTVFIEPVGGGERTEVRRSVLSRPPEEDDVGDLPVTEDPAPDEGAAT